MVVAAMELYDGLRRVGYRPATLLGLLAVVGLMAGAYAKGEAALPLVIALSVVFTLLWYLTGIIREAPTSNIGVTLLGILWVGVLGSFAAMLLGLPHRSGIAFLGGAVICTAAYDSFAYIGGNLFGKHLLAPAVSPKKTWEGAIVGTIGTVIVSGAVVSLVHPWTMTAALVLGVTVSVVAPIGDLAESLVKRDLGIKDMSQLLPGHGGVFDRFDALLFVLPATYYLARAFNLA
jgi:phosphatidate cytidylyltransferase